MVKKVAAQNRRRSENALIKSFKTSPEFGKRQRGGRSANYNNSIIDIIYMKDTRVDLKT